MSILNQKNPSSIILEKKIHKFRATNGELFETSIVTKNPIIIQLLLDCKTQTHILGADFTGKDIIIGFDFYEKGDFLLMPDGIKSKKFFKGYIDVAKIYFQPHELLNLLNKLMSSRP